MHIVIRLPELQIEYPDFFSLFSKSIVYGGVLRDLVPFVQLKEREKPKVILLHGCFHVFSIVQ